MNYEAHGELACSPDYMCEPVDGAVLLQETRAGQKLSSRVRLLHAHKETLNEFFLL